MVDVITQIIINKSLNEVSAFACNPDNAPLWYVNIKSVEWKTEKPLKLNSQIAFVAHFMGKKLSYTYQVIEMNENKFVMRTSQGPFPMETTYTFKKIGDNITEMSLRNCGNPTGFSKLFAPFMSMMMRNVNMKDLRKLKSILE
ncbi:MAG: SRPBCC family protein [Bacteroidetes bacterium]|nr:SRPBCC family protein [Bacteroidota bacterium]